MLPSYHQESNIYMLSSTSWTHLDVHTPSSRREGHPALFGITPASSPRPSSSQDHSYQTASSGYTSTDIFLLLAAAESSGLSNPPPCPSTNGTSLFFSFWRPIELPNDEIDLKGLFTFRSRDGSMPFSSGPIMGRQALTMAILGSIVDQMSASTAVPVVPKASQRDRNDPRIEDSMGYGTYMLDHR